MADEPIVLKLTKAQALVLFDWVSRTDSAEGFKFADTAEQQVIWDIEAQLERTLVEPLAADYDDLLAQARKEVRDSDEAGGR